MDIKYDQHFLTSKNVLFLESNLAYINENDIIFEIGPGKGYLTHFLLEKKPKKLIVCEVDELMKEDLNKLKEKYNSLEIVFDNALNYMDKIEFNKLVSNIPYSITEPLYLKIMEKKIPFVILLHGINFYHILTDINNKFSYLINAFYDLELIKEIPGNAFEPKAKTMSSLVRLKLKDINEINDFEKFIRIIFEKRDRTTKNTILFSFVDYFKISKKEALIKLYELKLNDYQLSRKFINLSNEDSVLVIERIKSLFENLN